MPEKAPLISIIMATFNRGHLIEQTLRSIKNQTFFDWECLIIDDGSIDDTEEVVLSFLKAEHKFRYYKRSTDYAKGLPGSRNMGLDLAKGQTIIFFDDDDIVHPENLEVNFKILTSRKAMFCRYDKTPFTGEWKLQNFNLPEYDIAPFGSNRLPEMIMGTVPFASCTVLWNKMVFLDERFNENLFYAEEWELYSRILSKGFEGVSIDLVLYYNRKHTHSNTGKFWNNDPIRRASKVKAVKLVITNLAERKLLTQELIQYFIRMGFFLKESEIIFYVLKLSDASLLFKLKYRVGYLFYPFIRPFFILKSKLLKR